MRQRARRARPQDRNFLGFSFTFVLVPTIGIVCGTQLPLRNADTPRELAHRPGEIGPDTNRLVSSRSEQYRNTEQKLAGALERGTRKHGHPRASRTPQGPQRRPLVAAGTAANECTFSRGDGARIGRQEAVRARTKGIELSAPQQNEQKSGVTGSHLSCAPRPAGNQQAPAGRTTCHLTPRCGRVLTNLARKGRNC
jgi:hypothetical protein